VDMEFEMVPRLGAFTARRFPGRDLQLLGRQPNRSLHLKLLVLGAVDKIGTELFQVPHVRAGQSDPNLVQLGCGDLGPGGIILFLPLIFGDVTHPEESCSCRTLDETEVTLIRPVMWVWCKLEYSLHRGIQGSTVYSSGSGAGVAV